MLHTNGLPSKLSSIQFLYCIWIGCFMAKIVIYQPWYLRACFFSCLKLWNCQCQFPYKQKPLLLNSNTVFSKCPTVGSKLIDCSFSSSIFFLKDLYFYIEEHFSHLKWMNATLELAQAVCVRHPRWHLQCVAGHCYYRLWLSLSPFSFTSSPFSPLQGNSRGWSVVSPNILA